jgi:CheY-like chemotaxis protein
VHRALHEAAFTVQHDVQERQITLQFDLRADPGTIEGDEVRVQQVFWNVLKNAVKFTPVSGTITVGTRADEGNVIIEVTDTGIGMEPHELSRIFNAFAQGDHAEAGGAHRFGGLGLGLAISRKLVELHGGRIEAFSEGKGRGSTFRVVFPRQQPAKPGPAASAEPAKATANSPENAAGQSRLHLLVVEDHASTRDTLEKLLVRRGHRVSAVASTDAALAAAAQQRFDLVVSDIGLPDGDGYQLMSTLRELYGLCGVALSGYGMQRDLDRSREAGFVAHLTKPIRLESLDSVIERYRTSGGSQFDANIDRAS